MSAPVVVLRALGLGDTLTGVPALHGLRRRHPGRRLLLAAPLPQARLLLRYGIVDGIVPTAGLDAEPPGLGYPGHLAVNLHGCGPDSHRLLLAGAPSGLLAYACPDLAVRGPDWDPGEHEVHRWCRLAGWGSAVRGLPGDLVLPGAGTAARDGPVVIHPGATVQARRWPAARFAAVAAALGRHGLPVVVTGSAGEAAICAQVVSRAGSPEPVDLCGRLDLDALTGLLSRARLLVCGDTGVAHLGTALRTPSVLLFGPVDPRRWGPLVDRHLHRVIWHGEGDGSPDPQGGTRGAALLRITAAEVVDAALDVLGAGGRAGRIARSGAGQPGSSTGQRCGRTGRREKEQEKSSLRVPEIP